MINFSKYDYLYNDEIITGIIEDSLIKDTRVTTFLIRLPRIILPEMNTHRVFSRNVSSSRAKRFSTLLKDATFNPVLWVKNHKGMQGNEIHGGIVAKLADIIWTSSKYSAIVHAWLLDKLNISKQYSNRIIEPYSYVDYLVTATDFDNFIKLRDDNAAQFEIQVVARQIKTLLQTNYPSVLEYGHWHLPFINSAERKLPIKNQVKLSVARCARTSYSNQDIIHNYEKDYNLHDRLISMGHMSPTEHQVKYTYGDEHSGNLSAGTQYRKLIEVDRLDLL